jgi:hypothetical protein
MTRMIGFDTLKRELGTTLPLRAVIAEHTLQGVNNNR